MSARIEFGAPVALAPRSRGVVAVGDKWFAEAHAKGIIRADADGSRKMYVRGYATRYRKAHSYKGRFDMFEPGVFASSLLRKDTVRLLDSHDEGRLLAATNGYGLEIASDSVGLSFLAALPNNDLGREVYNDVKEHRKLGMSVGYRVQEHEDVKAAGETVRLIKAATLQEISIVAAGAVLEAYVENTDLWEMPKQDRTSADASGSLSRLQALTYQLGEALRN